MIDPATRWFEVAEIPSKESITVAEQVDKYWLCPYPSPTKVIYDCGSEFIGPSFQELIKDVYKVKASYIGQESTGEFNTRTTTSSTGK